MSSQKGISVRSPLNAAMDGMGWLPNPRSRAVPSNRTAPLLPTRAMPAASTVLPIVVGMSASPSSLRLSGAPVVEISIHVPGRLSTMVTGLGGAGGDPSVTSTVPKPVDPFQPPTRM